jgi:hypothetical protein
MAMLTDICAALLAVAAAAAWFLSGGLPPYRDDLADRRG